MTGPIRVGAHPSNASLAAFAARPDLHAELAAGGAPVDVFSYGGGNQTVPLVRAGALDVVGTGSTPPLLALALGLDVVVIAVTAPRHDPGGLIVHADGAVATPGDLRGRSIGLMPTSWHPHYLIKALQAYGLDWHDVIAVELDNPTAREAFRRRGIDAWIVTGPDATALTEGPNAPGRVLLPVQPHLSNRSVLWATRAIVDERSEEIRALLAAIEEASPGDNTWWHPAGEDFLAEQADGAYLLSEAGALPAASTSGFDVYVAVANLIRPTEAHDSQEVH